MAINLSINLNKVALLRNSRGAHNPSPVTAAELCIACGVQGLTLHWRHDERHTRQQDVRDLRALARERGLEFNLEGDMRDELVAIAFELQVDQFTLVPVTPGEITSDHGWDLPRETARLQPVIAQAKKNQIKGGYTCGRVKIAAQSLLILQRRIMRIMLCCQHREIALFFNFQGRKQASEGQTTVAVFMVERHIALVAPEKVDIVPVYIVAVQVHQFLIQNGRR